uniref:Uncharacterized protein n=1 Tax=Chenopodium quinoa TaxID=63459 RepID=A0A803LFQ1_CHEQI
MPGLAAAQRNDQSLSNANSSYYSLSINNNGSISSCNGFWSKHRDDINYNQLQKFWSELSPQARQDLLRLEKQTLFEQARKNLYCSRCNGLLLEGHAQIVLYGKSLQHEGAGGQLPCSRLGISKDQLLGGRGTTPICQDESQDPSVHPWGGLITTRDGSLTLLDCYLYSKSLKGLQNVFDSARARERERELLYPDACGGGGRGWISQGIPSYGRGHGTRDTCALHTARLSCDTLVDFWSALGEETRHSLLRMKEEDFIERLVFRFDHKRFCRDCRRNVLREFKELKELKRTRREPRCTSWFCVADTAFQYEVSNDTILADWHQTFIDSIGTYHHFEWAVGTGEGKSDILDFENVGMNGSVEVNGLDLDGLNACYITLRAWKLDGRCSEFSVKAHALKGRPCVHCRLAVGDGYVTITHGESIRRFFEHAEEAEEEEDDDSMDKDGNDLDGECSRPQKHAKSPELAREFLLDAATVIFKEQACSIFLSTYFLNIGSLRERLRDKDKDKKCSQSSETPIAPEISEETLSSCIDEEATNSIRDSVSENGDTNVSESASPEFLDESSSNDYTASDFLHNNLDGIDGDLADVKEENGSFSIDSIKGSRWKLKAHREFLQESSGKWSDRRRSLDNGAVVHESESRYYDDPSENFTKGANYFTRQSRASPLKFTAKSNSQRLRHKVQCSNVRMTDRSDLHSCGCNQPNDYREKVEPHMSGTRFNRESRSITKTEIASDVAKPVHRINKFSQTDYARDNCGRTRSKISSYSSVPGRDSPHTKKVWEPVEPQKRCPRSNSDSDVTLRSCDFKTEENESTSRVERSAQKGSQTEALYHPKDAAEEENDSCLMTSNNLNRVSDFSASSSSSSDNFSSCQSEGDSNTPSSNHQNVESSSITDSEDSSEQSEGRDISVCVDGLSEIHDAGKDKNQKIEQEAIHLTQSSSFSSECVGNHYPWNSPTKTSTQDVENGKLVNGLAPVQQGLLPSIHNPSISFPVFQAPSTVGYYHQNSVPWSAASANGMMAYPQPNHYLMTSPIGYGLNGDSHFCMPYSQVQHVASPFMNSHQIPVYQPVHTANILNQQEKTNAPEVHGVRDTSGESRRENVVIRQHPGDAPSKGGSRNLTQSNARNSGFSLFQFGGPTAALPTYRNSVQLSDEQKAGDLSSCHVEGEHGRSKKESTIEEYNLFAARNGIQFSIF